MEIDFSPVVKSHIYNARQHAYWAKTSKDTRISPIENCAIEDAISQLKDMIKNPTVAQLAEREQQLRYKKNYPTSYKRNERIIAKDPYVMRLRQIYNETIARLYPRTIDIRNYIISSGRLSLDKVTRKKPIGLLELVKLYVDGLII